MLKPKMQAIVNHPIIRLSNVRLLGFILVLKCVATFICINIYARLTVVSDPFNYVSGDLGNGGRYWGERTQFVGNMAHLVASEAGPSAAHYLFSAFSGLCIWLFVRELRSREKKLAMLFFFLPSVAMWTSVVGKELLAGCGVCLILLAWIRCIKGTLTLTHVALGIGGFFLYNFMRAHYAVAALYFVFITIALNPRELMRSQTPALRLFRINILSRCSNPLVLLAIAICFIFVFPKLSEGIGHVIDRALIYFPSGAGGSNRHDWVVWRGRPDFWRNAWWSIPFGMIGPLPHEVLKRPEFILNFLEGLIIVIIPFVALALKLAAPPRTTLERYQWRIFMFAWIPQVLLLMLINAPFATPNAGSAVRYRAGLEWLITIPGILFFCWHPKQTRSADQS